MSRGLRSGLTALFLLVALIWSTRAHAESGDFNVHLEIGPGFALTGWQAEELGVGMSGAGKFEFGLKKWIGINAGLGYLQFFKGKHPEGYEQIDGAHALNGSLGLRFRPLNDESGYKWPWTKTPNHMGNLLGNLWIDLHADYYYTGGLNRFGADAGLGFELSVLNGLQMGPFARGMYIFQSNSSNDRDSDDGWILIAGLSFSVAIPPGSKKMYDSDLDGLYDPVDTCPDEPEDRDGFEDEDGCPDKDNDEDGIPDTEDNCPLTKEDMDGILDHDGCPDNDNDGDGIQDDNDKCPADPEDIDGFEDLDGCPDPDNDGDGILDEADQCPGEAETVNELKDEDGCPEPDTDGDGFVDELDKCPEEPETVNGVEDDDGCPDEGLVEVKENKILLGERIFFDFSMARVKTRSRIVLEQLANLMKVHPEYVIISIEGHSDPMGSKEFNLKLSRRRAKRVKKYLIKLGVKKSRLVVKSLGESEPWIAGRGKKDRKMNRRVELVIEEMDESMAMTPVADETKKAFVEEEAPQNEEELAPEPAADPEQAEEDTP